MFSLLDVVRHFVLRDGPSPGIVDGDGQKVLVAGSASAVSAARPAARPAVRGRRSRLTLDLVQFLVLIVKTKLNQFPSKRKKRDCMIFW